MHWTAAAPNPQAVRAFRRSGGEVFDNGKVRSVDRAAFVAWLQSTAKPTTSEIDGADGVLAANPCMSGRWITADLKANKGAVAAALEVLKVPSGDPEVTPILGIVVGEPLDALHHVDALVSRHGYVRQLSGLYRRADCSGHL